MSTKSTSAGISLILLDRRRQAKKAFATLDPQVITSEKALRGSISKLSKDSLLISYESDLTNALMQSGIPWGKRLGIGVFVHEIDIKTILELSGLFRKIAFAGSNGFIPAGELAEVLTAPNRSDLAIGGLVNDNSQRITFWRGNFETLSIPFSAFEKSGDGSVPDFEDFSIIDSGQTVKLGQYEAAFDSILYEFDPGYRRAASKKRLKQDRSLGAAIRRLRKQRGLTCKNFEPEIAEKTLARIETGKVAPDRIRKSTLEAIATRLQVKPEELATF